MTTEVETKQRNNELFDLVVGGSKVARDEMIVLNMPLVTFKVDAYLSCFPHLEYLRDDLVGEGNLALVEVMNHIGTGNVKAGNVTGYLSLSIQKRIGQAIDGEMFTTSKHSVRRWRREGENANPLHKVPNSDFVLSQLENDTRKEADLLDAILDCCESDEERAIVDLRIKGYKDDEIASQLEISKTTIFMLRRQLYQRCIAAGEIISD